MMKTTISLSFSSRVKLARARWAYVSEQLSAPTQLKMPYLGDGSVFETIIQTTELMTTATKTHRKYTNTRILSLAHARELAHTQQKLTSFQAFICSMFQNQPFHSYSRLFIIGV